VGLEQLPSAGLVGAAGVATLLVFQRPLARAAGVALFVGGAVPLGLHLESGAVDRVAHRPAVLVAGGIGLAAALLVGILAAVRFPAAVPAAALVAGLRFPLSAHPRPVEHLAPMYAILVCGLAGLLWRTFRGKGPPNRLGAVGVALAVVVGVAALSLTWSVDVDQGAYALVAYYLPLGVLAALIGTLEITSRYAARLAALQIAIACVLALVALYEEETRRLFFNDKLITTNAYTTFFRVNSLIFDPSLYGRFAMLSLLTCLSLLLLAPPSRAATASAFAIPLIAAGLFFTYSQSSLVALACGTLAIAGMAWPRKALIGGAAVLAVVVIGGFALPQTRHVLAASPNKLSSSRLDLARRGGDAFRKHPLRGVGLGGYSVAASRTGTRRSRLAPHDLIVEAASEQGLLGLAALAAFGVAVVRAVRAPRRTPVERAIRTVLAIELGALTVHSLAYDTFFEDPLVWAFAAFLAAGAYRVVAREEEPAPEAAEARAVPA
jgi:hypothetical protein